MKTDERKLFDKWYGNRPANRREVCFEVWLARATLHELEARCAGCGKTPQTCTCTIREDEIDALFWAIDLAHGDQENYLHTGNPELDYGDEWPEAARAKAEHLRQLANIARRYNGSVLAQKCDDLADELQPQL